MKIDAMNEVEVSYVYDISDPATYGSNNNRLMYYSTVSTANQMSTPVSTTWYYYNESGNTEYVVTEQAANPGVYGAYRLGYAHNGEAVSFVVGESWSEDGPDAGACADNYSVSFAREFRYDTGRARYLNRELDPVALMQTPPQFVPFSETWSDYDGDEVYGDYTVTPGFPTTIDDVGSYEPGQWESVSGVKSYLHSDLIGTLRSKSNSGGAATDRPVYTAFGQRVCAIAGGDCTGVANPRYGYAGAWGYQSHEDFPFLHIGARYYDPATGRFLQRDPIGIAGGLNVYAYVVNRPTVLIDPNGQIGIFGFEFNGEWAKSFWGDVGRGSAATADGFIPVFDPFDRFYDSKKDPATKWSKRGGKFAYLCISAPRVPTHAKNIWKFIQRLRSPNPPKYVPIRWPNMQSPHPLKGSMLGG